MQQEKRMYQIHVIQRDEIYFYRLTFSQRGVKTDALIERKINAL